MYQLFSICHIRVGIPLRCSLTNSPWCQTVSKAFLTSSNATYAFLPFSLMDWMASCRTKAVWVGLYWTYASYHYYCCHQYPITHFSFCVIIISRACHVIQSATCFCERKCVAGWLTRLADLLLTDLAKNPKHGPSSRINPRDDGT